jgi:peptidylprolyl isomerase
LKGIQDAFNGIEPALEDSRTIEMITSLQERKFKNECENNLKAAEAFLASNKENKSIIELEEGKLQYRQLTAGAGKVCSEEDTPVIKYKGMYLDGAVFGQSEMDEPIALKETIEGFRRAIIGMKVGEKREVYIHPDLGYGSNSCLAPNALLTFEVELTGMKETAATENLSEMSDLPGMDTFALDQAPHHDTVK